MAGNGSTRGVRRRVFETPDVPMIEKSAMPRCPECRAPHPMHTATCPFVQQTPIIPPVGERFRGFKAIQIGFRNDAERLHLREIARVVWGWDIWLNLRGPAGPEIPLFKTWAVAYAVIGALFLLLR